MSSTNKMPEWVFDPALPSQSRSGGDPAEYAFTPNIDTFVREVVQNSLDNPKDKDNPETVKIRFRLINLTGKAVKEFQQSVQWQQLEPHIRACSLHEINGRRWKQALEKLTSEKQLLLMVVEDSNTAGLTGDESEDKSNFAALCRHVLYSNKAQSDSAGSYGLGKAVLWRFSSFSTVFFNSVLADGPNNEAPPRFIGRTDFPWHKIDQRAYDGSGWFGLKEKSPNDGEWAISLWGETASEFATKTFSRRNSDCGTSIVIVGFQDPTSEEEQSPQNIAESIARSVSLNFWPSIINSAVEVMVEVFENGSEQAIFQRKVLPVMDDQVKEFSDALENYRSNESIVQEIRSAGDTVVMQIPFTVPAKKDKSMPAITSEVSLVVRLANEDSTNKRYENTVAFFRRPGMVIRYKTYANLSLNQRPFYAIVICGKARKNATEDDDAVEKFLQLAEPPSHNKWEVTPRLTEVYLASGSLIKNLEDSIREAIKRLFVERTATSQDGPILLRKIFPFGSSGVGDPDRKQLFTYPGLTAQVDSNGAWKFTGQIVASSDVAGAWMARVDVRFRGEDGGEPTGGVIKALNADRNRSRGKVTTP